MRFEILIAQDISGLSPNIYLDTFQQENISLNFNIADIADISNKNSSYSKTIKLPDTGRNRQAFSDIFNIESTSSTFGGQRVFNPNKKVKCLVLRDTLEIFAGNLQLTNIIYDYDTQKHHYEVVIYADNDNLYKNIGELYLSDLNLKPYDHSWNYQNVVGSWTASWTNGYYYPLIDYGFPINLAKLQAQTSNSTTFYPSFYLKTLINQIFTEAGYTYKSDFFDSEFFENLIIPFNNKNLIPSSGIITNNNVISKGSLLNSVDVSGVNYGNVDFGCITFDLDEYDPNGFFDASTSAYRFIGTQSITQRFTVKLDLILSAGSQATTTPPFQSWSDTLYLVVVRSKFDNGTNVPDFNTTPTYVQFNNYPTIKFGGQQFGNIRQLVENGTWTKQITTGNEYLVSGIISTDYFSPPLRNNEEVRFFIRRSINNQAANPKTEVISLAERAYFQAEINPSEASQFTLLEMKNIVPANVKQKDLLTSVIRMFNLYIEPDKQLANNFIIEPKDDYFAKYSVTKDWSSKLDLSNEITSEILSNIQDRTNLFTYKPDKDYYNAKYTEYNNQVFGEYKYDVDNDFLSGDKKIEVIFSPTPLNRLPGSSNVYMPSIFQNNNGNITRIEGMNIRLLYKNPKSLSSNEYFNIDGIQQTIYPYAGYVDDPLNPNVSLNFGQVDAFYSGYTETNNNIFYRYYQNTIDEVSNISSRKITAYLNLNPYDINDFRFSDLIYLTIGGMSSYYRVNKIIDYDPSKEQTTKVELTTALNYKLNTDVINLKKLIFNSISTSNPAITGRFNASTAVSFSNLVSIYFNTTSTDVDGVSISDWLANILDERVINNNIITLQLSELGAPINYGIYTVTPVIPSGPNFTWNLSSISSSGSLSSGETYIFSISIENTSVNRGNYQLQPGNRISPPQDLVMVGNINTDTSNRFTDINNIVGGSDNFITGYNNIINGVGNAIGGKSNIVNGDGNSNLASNAFILGSTISNVYPGSQPSLLIGNNISNFTEGSFLFGNNITLGVGTESNLITSSSSTFATASSGVFLIGNNITIDNPSNDLFLIGNNITLTQSIPSNLFYVGYDTIEFNTQNFITNVVGTSSFNKMVIADLVLQDIPNNTFGKFRLNQYNPADYPGGSYLEFNSPIPGLEMVYNDYDSGYLLLQRVNQNTFEIQQIFMDDNSITTQITKTNSNTEFSILPDGYEFRCSSPGSFNFNTETKINKQVVTSTSSTTADVVISTGLTDYQNFEVVILGSDQIANQRYSSRKVAMFKSSPFSQVGTTQTIYEITNMGTYSTNIQIQGTTIVVRVSGSVVNDTRWSIYATSYTGT